MTKRDYEDIAGIVRRWREADASGLHSGTLAEMANDMAIAFEERNPRFNSARFFTACGMDEDGDGWVI